MKNKANVHIIPHPDGWAVKSEGATKAAKVTRTKAEALDHGRDIARNRRVELIPHKKDGTIQNPNSYGNDPIPPRDKKH